MYCDRYASSHDTITDSSKTSINNTDSKLVSQGTLFIHKYFQK